MSTPLDVVYELFDGVPRQGPGCNAATRTAWALLEDLPPQPAILDIGCGSGIQTLELARLSQGRIVALDNHQPYLDLLQQRAAAEHLDPHIETLNASMEALNALDFPPASFDLIWSEGAIYILGFEQGMAACHPLLKPGGYLVVSDMTWFTSDPPQAVQEFWQAEQIDLRTVGENLQRIEQAGYRCIGHFALPRHAWWDDFYRLVEQNIPPLQQKYRDAPELLAVVNNQQREIDLYHAYNRFYGYAFYLMQA